MFPSTVKQHACNVFKLLPHVVTQAQSPRASLLVHAQLPFHPGGYCTCAGAVIVGRSGRVLTHLEAEQRVLCLPGLVAGSHPLSLHPLSIHSCTAAQPPLQ